MPSYSGFRDLDKLTNNTGRLPAALTPATQIQFLYQFQEDLTGQLEFSAGDIVIVTADATFLLRGPESAPGAGDGAVLLEWKFSVTYLCAADEFGFTYYASRQSVTVLQPAATPQMLGSPDGIAIPGGGSFPAGADVIQEGFESPIFVLAVPAGATVKVTHHTAGFPALDDIEGLSVQTRPGGGGLSGFRSRADGAAHLLVTGAATQTVRARGRERVLDPPVSQDWGADGPGGMLQSPGQGRALALYPRSGGVYRRTSDTDGRTWGDEMLIYANKGLLGASALPGGGCAALLSDALGDVWVGISDRSGSAVTFPANLPAGVTLSPGVLLASDSGLDFFWEGMAGVNHLHSADGGRNWS